MRLESRLRKLEAAATTIITPAREQARYEAFLKQMHFVYGQPGDELVDYPETRKDFLAAIDQAYGGLRRWLANTDECDPNDEWHK